MPLWIVHKPNDRFKRGTFFEETDWGVQEAIIKRVGNKLTVEDTKGFIFPVAEIQPYALRISRNKVDWENL